MFRLSSAPVLAVLIAASVPLQLACDAEADPDCLGGNCDSLGSGGTTSVDQAGGQSGGTEPSGGLSGLGGAVALDDGSGGASNQASGGSVLLGGNSASGGSLIGSLGGSASGGTNGGSGGKTATEDIPLIEDIAYVFSSFTGNGEDGLHLIASFDGFEWDEVADYASVFQQASELMRDPSVVYGPDGLFHMVWTTGWEEQNIAVAHSSDLLNWTEETLFVWADYVGPGTEESDGSAWPGDTLTVPVARNDYVHNSWAPEIFYDRTTGEYVIYWSSTIDSPEIFPETWDARADHLNHRIYFVTTRDFKTYSKRRLFYQPADRLVIDAFVCQLGADDYRMVIKDEADSGYGNLHISTSTLSLSSWAEMPKDFWSPLTAVPFAGGGVAPDFARAEGPGGVLIGHDWFLYADYWTDGQTQAWRAGDFVDIQTTNEIEFPFHLRHGTIFQAPREVVEHLFAL